MRHSDRAAYFPLAGRQWEVAAGSPSARRPPQSHGRWDGLFFCAETLVRNADVCEDGAGMFR